MQSPSFELFLRLAYSYKGPTIPLFIAMSPRELDKWIKDIIDANAFLPNKSDINAGIKAQWPPRTRPAKIVLISNSVKPPNAARLNARVFKAPSIANNSVLQDEVYITSPLQWYRSITFYLPSVVAMEDSVGFDISACETKQSMLYWRYWLFTQLHMVFVAFRKITKCSPDLSVDLYSQGNITVSHYFWKHSRQTDSLQVLAIASQCWWDTM